MHRRSFLAFLGGAAVGAAAVASLWRLRKPPPPAAILLPFAHLPLSAYIEGKVYRAEFPLSITGPGGAIGSREQLRRLARVEF